MWRSLRYVPKSLIAQRPLYRFPTSNGLRFASSASRPGRMSMKELAKKYGWTATGVYCAFMAIDLPLSFLFVHSLGPEKLENMEISIRGWVGADTERDSTYVHKAAAGGRGLLLAEFGIAYLIHKVLIVVRLPLTVAVTPRVAAKLQEWGFKVNRAVPTVDKQVLAKTVNEAKDTIASQSPATARVLDKIIKDAPASSSSQAVKQTQEAVKNIEKLARDAKPDAAKQFGRPANKKNRWFAGFF